MRAYIILLAGLDSLLPIGSDMNLDYNTRPEMSTWVSSRFLGHKLFNDLYQKIHIS
jgi:hypothetical protein